MAGHEDTETEVILQVALDELRIVHEKISNVYDQLRIRILALLAGQVAIVTFLFSGDKDERIHLPLETSGKIFLAIGILCMILAFILFVYLIASTRDWPIPGDMNEIEQINNGNDNRYDSLEKFLLFLRKDYLEGNRECIKTIAKKATKFNLALYLLLAGVIILLVIKYGGMHK
jgi:hypothetical protein